MIMPIAFILDPDLIHYDTTRSNKKIHFKMLGGKVERFINQFCPLSYACEANQFKGRPRFDSISNHIASQAIKTNDHVVILT